MTTITIDPAVRAAACAIAVPRAAPADSFVLHAPLELLARVGLLEHVHPSSLDAALRAIADLGTAYEATGPAVVAPPAGAFASAPAAAVAVDAAIRAGDADGADAAMIWLTDHADLATVRRLLARAIVDSLAAAGHAPIGLHLLPLVAGGAMPASLLRGAVRTIASRPQWRVTWFHSARVDAPAVSTSMAAALAAVPRLGRPGSDFIFPLMSQVQDSGVAAEVLTPVTGPGADVAAGGRALVRAATWSMLHDDPTQAPYGWTHCLTMPQAVLSLAGDGVDERTVLAVAATYVAGFRAAHGTVALGSLDDDAGERVSASAPVVGDLATFAALHHDAHLVKYTLACIHAAAADPAWAGTHLRAAAFLADWWRAHPDAG